MDPPQEAAFRRLLARLSAALLSVMAVSGCGSVENWNHPRPVNVERADVPGVSAAVALLRSSLGATANAPIASTWSGAVMLKDRTVELVRGVSPEAMLKVGKVPDALDQAGGPEFEAYLDEQGFQVRAGGSVALFVDGKTYFPELLAAIKGAESGVDIQTYIFDNDPYALGIADVLKEKSRDVPVRVRFDALGSEMAGEKDPPALGEDPPEGPRMHCYLENGSHVQVRRFLNPWLVSDHSKMHIIDHRIAYVGGMNIGWEYYHDWHDMMVRIEGPAVGDLVDAFETRWRGGDWMRNWGLKWTGRPDRIRPPDSRDASGDIPLRMLVTHADSGRREFLRATIIAIRCASRRVWIQAPYLTSDRIALELEEAVRRGVDVRVVIPGDNDSDFMDALNGAALEQIAAVGGKVYSYPGMTHLKAAVFDEWATFGSSNYDTLSLSINREVNFASSHPALVEELVHRIFLPDFRKSRRLTKDEVGRFAAGAAAKLAGGQL